MNESFEPVVPIIYVTNKLLPLQVVNMSTINLFSVALVGESNPLKIKAAKRAKKALQQALEKAKANLESSQS